MNDDLASKSDAVRAVVQGYILRELELCRASPQEFADILLAHWMKLPRPKFHEELYQLCSQRRLLIEAPRYFSKSTVFSKIYPLWKCLNEPRTDFMIVSATEALAVELLAYVKGELESNEKLRDYYGDQITDIWRQDEVKLRNGSRIMAKGQGFQIRGLHPTHVVCDDLESDHVESQDQRKKLYYWFNTTLKGALDHNSQLIVVGTVMHPQSLLKELEGEDEWTFRKYTALDSDEKSIWEEKAPTSWLHKLRDSNRHAFEQEYMNNPLRSGETVFRQEWLDQKVPFPPPVTELVYTAVDLAISKREGASYTAIVTFGVHDNKIYELEAKRGRWSTNEIMDEIRRTYQTWMPMMIGIEDVAYQRMMIEILNRDSAFLPVQPIKADKDKRRRAMGVAHLFQKGIVHLSNKELRDELIVFTGTDHDQYADLVDAAVHALHLIQRYCFPDATPSTETRYSPELSEKEKAIWNGVRNRTSHNNLNNYDRFLGDEW
jgi:predicted phage terminase large subunit-like protein